PIDVAVIEVGMGGRWDATNVADAQVAVVTPIGLDHCDYLGETIELIAGEKAGIIKAGGIAVLGEQVPDAATVLLDRCGHVGATVARYGVEFDVLRRDQAVGGQVLALRGLAGAQVDDVFLPLLGRHQATNAATALAAVEAFLGGGTEPLDPICVRQGFAAVTSPGRLEVLARQPTVLVDAAHNPHGMQALAEAMAENFTFDTVVGVVGVLADKDAREMLLALEPIADLLVVTQPGSPRALAVADLHELALEIFGTDRVVGAFTGVDAALNAGIELAGSGQWGDAGVLVTGSIVLVGQVRAAVAGGGQVG
ncbi:MAG: bifunctional folylpolyglutamate synthase/dihydrofolate synthase, partial [Actinomycetales bacterium]